MPLPEDIRQEYLQALGIDSYFPRVRLPAAPEPVAFDRPASWQPAAADTPVQEPRPVAATTRAATGKSAEPAPARERKTPVEVKTASIPDPDAHRSRAENKPAAAADEIHLQGICIHVNPALAIFNAMPHLGPQQLGPRHRALLINMLKAGGIDHEQLRIDDKPFRWPMVQGGHMDNGRAAAATALSAYLQQKQADWQFRHLMILGETAVKQVFGSQEGPDENLPDLESLPWRNFFARSLDECLQRPVLKNEVWQVIRQLKQEDDR